ncbi:hypothetical protein EVA_15327 [gut metagenome]|uniref:Uncharacterized protein n=1 Tax=gut metagenome TaxID=749906 RepID=J9C9L7_9ZZZZ
MLPNCSFLSVRKSRFLTVNFLRTLSFWLVSYCRRVLSH